MLSRRASIRLKDKSRILAIMKDGNEALRPMLKSWLDENLPRVVERMAQAGIERVTRGRKELN